MNVRITQIDGKLPNLALMKLSHYHKQQGHSVFFEKSVTRGLFEKEYDIVYGSSIFTTSSKKIELFRTSFPNAIIGGTGTESQVKVEDIIGCGQYDYENYDYSIYPDFTHSIGFTQRGCRLRCSFCVVPKKEGKNAAVNTIHDIWRGPGHPKKIHLLDNDFFGQENWEERAQEIIDGDFEVCFNQGINVRLINEKGADYISKMKYRDDSFRHKRIYTAWDNKRDESIFMKGISILTGAGINPRHILVYMLCGYWKNETFDDIYYRFERMVAMGLIPYPMVYIDSPNFKELKKFQQWVVRRYYQITPWEAFRDKTESQYYAEKSTRGNLKLF